MYIFESDFNSIQKEFIQYIAEMRFEIQKYAERDNKSEWYLNQQNEKLSKVYNFKKRYDRLFSNILIVINESYETGKAAGIKESEKKFELLLNPYSKEVKANKEAFRAAHKANVIEKWAHLY